MSISRVKVIEFVDMLGKTWGRAGKGQLTPPRALQRAISCFTVVSYTVSFSVQVRTHEYVYMR